MPTVKNCLSLVNAGHLVIVILTAISVAGTGVGVYTSLNATISTNSRAIADLKDQLDKLYERTDNVQREQKEYNAELRNRLMNSDKEMREGLRILGQKLIDVSIGIEKEKRK